MTTKIFSLGAGKHQLPLIQAIRDLGFIAVAAGLDPNEPGAKIADVFYPLSIIDNAPGILRAAELENVAAVLTTSSGAAIRTVSIVADKLGLPGPSAAAVDNTLNKLNLKQALAAQGLKTPAYSVNDDLPYPYLFKPIAGIGGQNIFYVPDVAVKPVLVNPAAYYQEEFLSGTGLSLYGIVTTNETKCLLALEKIASPPDFKTRAFKYLPRQTEHQELFTQVAGALKINFAPFFQIDFINHDNVLYAIDAGIELDPRVAIILHEYFQYDIYSLMVRLALAAAIPLPDFTHPGFIFT